MATGNYLFHTNLNMQCPICPKLHMFDKCAGLNTSTCQYPVIVIAPPAGSRKFGTYKWLWHIPPIFITLNAYCSPFAVFLKPPLAVSPGARSRSSLLAALITNCITNLMVNIKFVLRKCIPYKWRYFKIKWKWILFNVFDSCVPQLLIYKIKNILIKVCFF